MTGCHGILFLDKVLFKHPVCGTTATTTVLKVTAQHVQVDEPNMVRWFAQGSAFHNRNHVWIDRVDYGM